MSFKLSKNKKFKGMSPIARVRGGKEDKMYLYLETPPYKISDVSKEVLEEVNEEEYKILEDAIHQNLEPDEEKLTDVFYKCKDYLKNKTSKYTLRSGGKLEPLPHPKLVEKILVSGISGSGKSVFCSRWIYNYLKKHRKNNFYIFSSVDEDEPLDKLGAERPDAYDVACDGMDLEDVENSIFLFDDIATISDRGTRKGIEALRNDLLECGRHYSASVVCTSHLITNGWESRRVINESLGICLFPKSNAKHIKAYLKNYEQWNECDILRCLHLNSRWFFLVKNPIYPHYVIHEKGCYLV